MKPIRRNGQRGAVLVIALLFLTILTILGVTAMTATTFEEKMAGNTRDVALAFQAADAALRDARRDINNIVIAPFADPRKPRISGNTGFGDGTDTDNGSCGAGEPPSLPPHTRGLCRPGTYDRVKGIQPAFNANSLDLAKSVEYGKMTGALMPNLMLSQKPRYIIEVMCFLPPAGTATIGGNANDYCNFYRITATGYGGNPNTRVTVQEIFLSSGS